MVDAARLVEKESTAASVEGVEVAEVLVGLVEDGLAGGSLHRIMRIDYLENVLGGVGRNLCFDGKCIIATVKCITNS